MSVLQITGYWPILDAFQTEKILWHLDPKPVKKLLSEF